MAINLKANPDGLSGSLQVNGVDIATFDSSGFTNVLTISSSALGTGTANSTTYLRGDRTWATISASGGGLTYVVKTANYTAQDKEGILADTTVGPFTVTLPATPTTGAQVVVADSGGVWETNNLTVARNGSTIAGLAENLVCNISNVSVQFVYDGTTWEVYTQIGGTGGTAAAAILFKH